jgi:predicted nucleic acid-binding protein
MRKIYFDTNQLYYIRRIADEAQGWDYGSYVWAYEMFPNDPDLVQDIRALCYIVALQYEWDLDFFPSNASYSELSRSRSSKAQNTQNAWQIFSEGLSEKHQLKRIPFMPERQLKGRPGLPFITDLDDREIIRDFANSDAEVLLTSDTHILTHRDRLSKMGITVMRPSEWINKFLDELKGNNDAVDWLENVLFGIGD